MRWETSPPLRAGVVDPQAKLRYPRHYKDSGRAPASCSPCSGTIEAIVTHPLSVSPSPVRIRSEPGRRLFCSRHSEHLN